MPPVVLLAIDGLRPDALAAACCPSLAALQDKGAWTLRSSSVMPSISLPCFVSMFHSQPPQRHGTTTNTWAPMAQPVAGLVDVAHAARLRCAFFHNWEPLRDLNRPGSLVFSYFRDNLDDVPGGDLVIAGEAARCIKNEQPDFTFVYLGTLDIAGHDHGWMSADYIACLEALDGAVDLLLSTLSPSATALVTADHGGHGRHHGSDLPEDMTVPLFLAGPGIRQNYEITSPVSILDVAPTLARVMALAAPPGWEGRCLDEAFVP